MKVQWNDEVTLLEARTSIGTVPDKALYVGTKFVTMVSQDYRLISNVEVTDAVETALAGEEYYRTILPFNGKHFHAVYELKNYAFGVQNDNSMVNPCLHVFNSYNKTRAFAIAVAAMRSICANYLYVGNPYVIKEIHKNGVVRNDKPEQIRELMGQTTKQIESIGSVWDRLNSYRLDWMEIDEAIKEIDVPINYKTAVRKMITASSGEMTAWRLLNAFSYVITSPIARTRGHAAYAKGSYKKMLNPNMYDRRKMMRAVQTDLIKYTFKQ